MVYTTRDYTEPQDSFTATLTETPQEITVKVQGIDAGAGLMWIAVALLAIAFWGEPDLVDALIYWLMK